MALLDLLKFNDDHGDVNSLAGSFVKFGGCAAIHPIQLDVRRACRASMRGIPTAGNEADK